MPIDSGGERVGVDEGGVDNELERVGGFHAL
jgi:hypothetical protein